MLRKPTTPRSDCVRSFVKHRGCRATGTDHAKAQVDPPFCILPPEDHTPAATSNVGRVQRLRWCQKFGQSFADRLCRRRPRPGDTWYMDEVFIRIQGVQHYQDGMATFIPAGTD